MSILDALMSMGIHAAESSWYICYISQPIFTSVYMRTHYNQRLTRFLVTFRLAAIQLSPLTVQHRYRYKK